MTVDMKSLARLGAQARLAELAAEIDAVLNAFRELAQQSAPVSQRHPQPAAKGAAPKRRARRVHRMSAAERKAVSVRTKRYWAERRKAKKG
jgi:hypothetical protein